MTLSSIPRSRVFLAATAIVGLVLWLHSGLGQADLLCLAPALAIAATLLVRRYPGERMLVRLAARGKPRRRRDVIARPVGVFRTVLVPRGGLLMAFALAVRPPPPALGAS